MLICHVQTQLDFSAFGRFPGARPEMGRQRRGGMSPARSSEEGTLQPGGARTKAWLATGRVHQGQLGCGGSQRDVCPSNSTLQFCPGTLNPLTSVLALKKNK